MPIPARVVDYLGAFCVLLAFGALLVGRVLMYPVALVEGTLLDRLATRPDAWDLSHRVMIVGAIAAIPAALALARVLRARSPWVVGIATPLLILAAALAVGQYALDFALLAAAQVEPRTAGQQFVDRLRAMPFVDWTFYRLANPAWVGASLFAVAMWRQGRAWRPAAILIALAFAFTQVQSQFGPLGPRIALGINFAGFALAAWRLVRPHELRCVPPRPDN